MDGKRRLLIRVELFLIQFWWVVTAAALVLGLAVGIWLGGR